LDGIYVNSTSFSKVCSFTFFYLVFGYVKPPPILGPRTKYRWRGYILLEPYHVPKLDYRGRRRQYILESQFYQYSYPGFRLPWGLGCRNRVGITLNPPSFGSQAQRGMFRSIGQYLGVFERIENVTAERVLCLGSQYAAYIKTWT
jgi:hypothetical protein